MESELSERVELSRRYDALYEQLSAYVNNTGDPNFGRLLEQEDDRLLAHPLPSKQFLEEAIARMQIMLTGPAS